MKLERINVYIEPKYFMKKSLLITLGFPPERGGVQNYYFNLCQNLPSDKIVVLTSLNSAPEVDVDFKIYHRQLLSKFFWPKWLLLFWQSWVIIKKEKIELIQVGQILPVGTVAWVFKKIFKIPYIVYIHGLDILLAQTNSRKKFLSKLILNSAQQVISNSEFTKAKIVKLGIAPEKITVIYPTIKEIPTTIDSSNLITKYNLVGKKIILTVCRLVERKGVDLVVRSLVTIAERFPNVVYVVVGSGPEKEKWENLAKKLLNDKLPVIFVGAVTDIELRQWYNLSDIFIQTPRLSTVDVEGFGLVYAEANSYGKPTITANVGGVIEAVIDGVTGFVVEPERPELISQAIVKLLEDDQLRIKLGQQGKARVLEQFNIKKQVEKLMEILK